MISNLKQSHKCENMYKLEIKRLNKEKKHYYNDNKFERQANIFMENNLKKCIRMFGDLWLYLLLEHNIGVMKWNTDYLMKKH